MYSVQLKSEPDCAATEVESNKENKKQNRRDNDRYMTSSGLFTVFRINGMKTVYANLEAAIGIWMKEFFLNLIVWGRLPA